MSEHVRIEKPERGIVSIVLDRPDRKNAITSAMYARMREAVQAADADREARVLVLSGGGGNFTSGNDIADFQKPLMQFPSPGILFLQAISVFRKPVVAAIAGHPVGIGTTMLLACDRLCAAETARFKLPYVNRGMGAEGASSDLLPAAAGYRHA